MFDDDILHLCYFINYKSEIKTNVKKKQEEQFSFNKQFQFMFERKKSYFRISYFNTSKFDNFYKYRITLQMEDSMKNHWSKFNHNNDDISVFDDDKSNIS